MVPEYARHVLDVVDRIPRGKVLAYGDIAAYLGEGGPRQVGAVMREYGHEVPWHRVLRSDGRPAVHKANEQLDLLRADGVPIRDGRVDMAKARWHPRRRSVMRNLNRNVTRNLTRDVTAAAAISSKGVKPRTRR